MSRRRALAAPVRLVAPLLAAALVLSSCTPSQDPGPDAGPTSAPGTGTAAPTAGGTPGSTPDGADGSASGKDGKPETDGKDGKPETGGSDGKPEAGKTDSDPETAGSAAPVGRSGGQSGGEGSEVAPAAPDGSGGDRLGDSVGPAAGRLTREQRTGTAAGLVPGFPDDVVLVPAGTTVASSSVTGTDGRYQVTLDATVDGACGAAVLDYRAWFTTGGFTETDTTARPGRTTVDLARDDGTVQLGASRTDAGCDVTVFATLSAK
ncbi:hypothetical protein [Promicromonospora panici]|uniref:hypothetical protein n=1 Tax=Promicromonospora panici TaxID=2219658 RepID=UPI00101B8946|nr:hypothetical protein [Promicromonospora panici]